MFPTRGDLGGSFQFLQVVMNHDKVSPLVGVVGPLPKWP